MKVCETCGEEIDTRDGDNECREGEDNENKATRTKANAWGREHDAGLRACGLVKVRGAMGGTYWE